MDLLFSFSVVSLHSFGMRMMQALQKDFEFSFSHNIPFSLIIFSISLVPTVMFSFIKFYSINLDPLSFSQLVGQGSVNLIFSKNQLLDWLILCIFFFVPISLNSCTDFYCFLTLTRFRCGLFLISKFLNCITKQLIYDSLMQVLKKLSIFLAVINESQSFCCIILLFFIQLQVHFYFFLGAIHHLDYSP